MTEHVTDIPKRNDWITLALLWLEVGCYAVDQAERVYAYSRAERSRRYERARDSLVRRLREERQTLRVERALLAKLHAERGAS